MQESHPLFGELEYDEYEGFITKKVVLFSGEEAEIELVISDPYEEGEIQEEHCEAYEAMLASWDKVVPDVLQAIIKYQNEHWDDSDHTQSYPMFKTVNDVLEHVKLISIRIDAQPHESLELEGRFVVLIFSAEWVNNDYKLLSVALVKEKVIEVTDQDI